MSKCGGLMLLAAPKEILKALEKPPSMTLSVQQTRQVVSFARHHYDRISRIVVHKLTDNNLGSKTLVSSTKKKIQLTYTYFFLYDTLI